MIDTKKLRSLDEHVRRSSMTDFKLLCECADAIDAQTAEMAGLKSQVEMLEACAAGDAALTEGQQREIALLREAQAWQPIETAPKDGTWILAWRGPATGGYWDPMVIVRWFEWPEEPGEAAWAWPDDSYDVWTSEGRRRADEMMMSGALFEDDSFTHWMPLPAGPDAALSGETHD